MADRPHTSTQMPLVAVVVALALVGVVAFMLWPRAEDAGEAGPFEAYDEPAEQPTSAPAPDAARGRDKAASGERVDARGRGSAVVLEDRVERDEQDSPPSRSADAGSSSQSSPDASYADPVNDQVLGPESWMAELPEDERDEIDEELDREPPEQFPLDLQVRREGIEVAKAVVFDCYDALRRREPKRTGRIIVSFDVVASGGQATLENTAIPTNIKLDDPQFETCIIDGIEGLRVPSSDEGEMHVEYPFLFDLEGKR